jgi:ATP-dependent Clp protease ATP-binding subunit ClpX
MEGVELIVEPSALDFVAEMALQYQLGARGLRSLCEAIFTDAMFDLPTVGGRTEKKQLVIDREYAAEKLEGSTDWRLKAA